MDNEHGDDKNNHSGTVAIEIPQQDQANIVEKVARLSTWVVLYFETTSKCKDKEAVQPVN